MTSTSVATKGAEALAGSKPILFRMKGSIEPASEPKVTMPDKGGADRAGDQHPMLAVVKHAELLPQRDPNDADEAEDRTKHQAGRQLA